jgi:hypothetical protein
MDIETVVGKLIRFWIWADVNLVDGHAIGVTEMWLDKYVRWPGFARAMQSQQWLVIESDRLVIPNFERHMGESAKKRLLAAMRAAGYRERKRHAIVTESSRLEKEKELDKKKKSTSSCDKPVASKPKAPTSEFRQMVLALEETVGKCATKPEHKRRSKTVKQLLEAGATAEEVRTRAGRYRRGWPEMELTDRALVEHWSKFRPDSKLGQVPLVEQED